MDAHGRPLRHRERRNVRPRLRKRLAWDIHAAGVGPVLCDHRVAWSHTHPAREPEHHPHRQGRDRRYTIQRVLPADRFGVRARHRHKGVHQRHRMLGRGADGHARGRLHHHLHGVGTQPPDRAGRGLGHHGRIRGPADVRPGGIRDLQVSPIRHDGRILRHRDHRRGGHEHQSRLRDRFNLLVRHGDDRRAGHRGPDRRPLLAERRGERNKPDRPARL